MIVNNSQFEVDRKGKARHFKSRFIEAGLVNYEPDGFGQVLVKKETIDKFLDSIVGCPVIVSHNKVSDDNVGELSVGVISSAWFNQEDGWFWCEGMITDKKAMKLIEDGMNVSCSYRMTQVDSSGGMWHDNPYDKEVLDGEFLHLALVPNPRYTDAMIALNSSKRSKMFSLFTRKEAKMEEAKTVVENTAVDKNSKKDALLKMLNSVLKGRGEVDGLSEEDFYKKFNGLLDEVAYDKDEKDNACDNEAKEEVKEDEKSEDDEKAKEEVKESKDEPKKESKEELKDLSKENADDKQEKDEKGEKPESKKSEEKSEDKDEDVADNASFDALNKASTSVGVKLSTGYMTQAERIALGKKLF